MLMTLESTNGKEEKFMPNVSNPRPVIAKIICQPGKSRTSENSNFQTSLELKQTIL